MQPVVAAANQPDAPPAKVHNALLRTLQDEQSALRMENKELTSRLLLTEAELKEARRSAAALVDFRRSSLATARTVERVLVEELIKLEDELAARHAELSEARALARPAEGSTKGTSPPRVVLAGSEETTVAREELEQLRRRCAELTREKEAGTFANARLHAALLQTQGQLDALQRLLLAQSPQPRDGWDALPTGLPGTPGPLSRRAALSPSLISTRTRGSADGLPRLPPSERLPSQTSARGPAGRDLRPSTSEGFMRQKQRGACKEECSASCTGSTASSRALARGFDRPAPQRSPPSDSLSTTLRSTPRVQTATPRVGKTARGLATRAPLGGPRSALPCPAWLGAGPTFVAELLKDSMREHPLAAPLNGPLAVSKPRF